MPIYTFSQGKIGVERGVYRPMPNKTKDADQAGILLLVMQETRTPNLENLMKDKEAQLSVSQNKTPAKL